MRKVDKFDASKWLVENKITFQSRLNEEYSSERINQRDVETAGGEVNHTFDTIDIMDLDNGYQVKIVSTYWYRDPGVKGYSERNSEENPMISGVKTTLIDPSGKPIKNHNFTGSGQWWMLTSGKDKFIPYITDWWKQKMGKTDLNEAEEEKKYYITMKSKDGKGGGTLRMLPNHIHNNYNGALRSIEYLRDNFKKGKQYNYYVSDIDGNPVDKDGNIINEEVNKANIDKLAKELEKNGVPCTIIQWYKDDQHIDVNLGRDYEDDVYEAAIDARNKAGLNRNEVTFSAESYGGTRPYIKILVHGGA